MGASGALFGLFAAWVIDNPKRQVISLFPVPDARVGCACRLHGPERACMGLALGGGSRTRRTCRRRGDGRPMSLQDAPILVTVQVGLKTCGVNERCAVTPFGVSVVAARYSIRLPASRLALTARNLASSAPSSSGSSTGCGKSCSVAPMMSKSGVGNTSTRWPNFALRYAAHAFHLFQ